jgi:hypothetical protein
VVAALLASCGLAAVGNHFALVQGGLIEVAQAMTAANIAYLAILAAVSLLPRLTWPERVRYVLVQTVLVAGLTFLGWAV